MSGAPILAKLESLGRVRGPNRDGWFTASCPVPANHANGDEHPSFGWKVHDDGHVQIRCQVNCSTDEIVSAVGMTKRDLFNGQSEPYEYMTRDRDGHWGFPSDRDADAARERALDQPTWRTLADVSDAPPGPLLFGMLEPASQTLAYGAPGIGKGMTGAYLIREALTAGMRPFVFDGEGRPGEWARRVSGLGCDRSRVAYIEMSDLPRADHGRPLWEVIGSLRKMIAATRADLFLVDGIMPATGLGAERLKSDAQVPYLWVSGLIELEIPSVSFGHPPKGQPEGDPFGSYAWVAAMRLTWLGTRAEGDGHVVRWRPRKRNERGHIPGVLLSIDYAEDGRPCAVERRDDDESSRDWLLGALVHGPRSVADLTEDKLGEYDDPPAGEAERTKERLSRTLRRLAHDGSVERIGGAGRGAKWQLRERL